MNWRRRLACAALAAALAGSAHAASRVQAPAPIVADPFGQCEAAISAAARLPGGVPPDILPAIGRAESGRPDPATGRVRPWPWTINVDGVGYYFATKDDAIAVVQTLQARGKQSIDVGCMQVNLMHHPDAFVDLDEAFDPGPNAAYAQHFLVSLYTESRSWALATARYHSSTPELGEEYQRIVFGRVLVPMGAGGTGADPAAVATALQAFPSLAQRFAAIPAASTQFGAFAPHDPAPEAATPFAHMVIGAYPNLLQNAPLTGLKP